MITRVFSFLLKSVTYVRSCMATGRDW